ncbi:hypothetical protein [Nocardia carnea]|uniref:hypothetical protein n=1 Tax=Nocardia carnea TaxID=37328 RepID=UPI00052685DD|nr:hypothetical protein [Nocardia carnea]
MVTHHASTIAARIIEHISHQPIDGLTLLGQGDTSPRPDTTGSIASPDDIPTHATESVDRDAAVIIFDVAQLSFNAEKGPVRWWLEVRSIDEQTGIDAFQLVAGGELVRDINPVIAALRAITLGDSGPD